MAGATLISRILGLIREQVMAALFGAGAATDAFAVAYRIPNMLRDLFAESAFPPHSFRPDPAPQQNPEQAKELFRSLFVLLGLTTTIISCAIIYLGPGNYPFVDGSKFQRRP